MSISQYKVVIPDSLIMPLIRWYHEILNHPGKDRTYLTIAQYFYPPRADVNDGNCFNLPNNAVYVFEGPWADKINLNLSPT